MDTRRVRERRMLGDAARSALAAQGHRGSRRMTRLAGSQWLLRCQDCGIGVVLDPAGATSTLMSAGFVTPCSEGQR